MSAVPATLTGETRGRPRATRRLALSGFGACLLAAVAWAACVPPQPATRDEPFEIPKGTFARRMAGEPLAILPDTIHLTLGTSDTLLLRNLDDVPQVFGPVLIMPGQSFRLPFSVASTYSFECSAHPNGGLHVIVDPGPAPGWERLSWRWQWLTRRA